VTKAETKRFFRNLNWFFEVAIILLALSTLAVSDSLAADVHSKSSGRSDCHRIVERSYRHVKGYLLVNGMENIRTWCVIGVLRDLGARECKLLPKNAAVSIQTARIEGELIEGPWYFIKFISDKIRLREDHDATNEIIDKIRQQNGLVGRSHTIADYPKRTIARDVLNDLKNCRDKVGSSIFDNGDYESEEGGS
jgi:hypothetical protein